MQGRILKPHFLPAVPAEEPAFSFLDLYTKLDILRVESFHNSQRRETVNLQPKELHSLALLVSTTLHGTGSKKAIISGNMHDVVC